jgi:hypothetical protein
MAYLMAYTSGKIDYNFYNTYIKNNLSNSAKKIFDKCFSYDKNIKDAYITYKNFKFSTNNENIYNELYLFNLDLEAGVHYALYVKDIKLNSQYDLIKKNRPIDMDDEDSYTMTINDIIKICSPKYNNLDALKLILNLEIKKYQF